MGKINNCNTCKDVSENKDLCKSCTDKYNRKKILVICTGNSCRSQMAEGWLRSFDERLEIISAGVKPEVSVNRFAIKVMKEVDINIENHYTKSVYDYSNKEFDYIVTVCDNAKAKCPVFSSKDAKYIHIPLEDPADATGSDEEITEVYRKVRDEIRDKFYELYKEIIRE